jgi:hypothetical protein
MANVWNEIYIFIYYVYTGRPIDITEALQVAASIYMFAWPDDGPEQGSKHVVKTINVDKAG